MSRSSQGLHRFRLALIGLLLLPAGPALPQQTTKKPNAGAIGQIVPANGVILLGGTPGAVVREVRVRAGDTVKAGTVLMTLQGSSIQANLDLANQELAAARAGGTAAAQDLAVQLAQQQLNEATRQLTAYASLGAQSAATGEVARLTALQNQARLTLQIEQARQRAARSETAKALQAATTRVALARAGAEIRAPSDGTILRIDRRPGQSLTADPAIQMADLRVIYVNAQVYEGDLLRLRRGMKARITSATLPRPLTGTVDEVGGIVDTRARLGDVRIRLDSVETANRLIGMDVEVVIGN
jgi:HlyD family secretion protein